MKICSNRSTFISSYGFFIKMVFTEGVLISDITNLPILIIGNPSFYYFHIAYQFIPNHQILKILCLFLECEIYKCMWWLANFFWKLWIYCMKYIFPTDPSQSVFSTIFNSCKYVKVNIFSKFNLLEHSSYFILFVDNSLKKNMSFGFSYFVLLWQ